MIILFKQELYKLTRRRSTWACTLGIMAINVFLAVISKLYPQHFILKNCLSLTMRPILL